MRKSNGMKWTIENLTHNFFIYWIKILWQADLLTKIHFRSRTDGTVWTESHFSYINYRFFQNAVFYIFYSNLSFSFHFWNNQKISYRNATRRNVRKITVHMNDHKLLHENPKTVCISKSVPTVRSVLESIPILSIYDVSR